MWTLIVEVAGLHAVQLLPCESNREEAMFNVCGFIGNYKLLVRARVYYVACPHLLAVSRHSSLHEYNVV